MVPFFPPRGALSAASGQMGYAPPRMLGGASPLQSPRQMQVPRNMGVPGQQMARQRFGFGGIVRMMMKRAREKKFGTPWTAPKGNLASTPTGGAGPSNSPMTGPGAARQRTAMSMDDYLNYGMGPARNFYEPATQAAAPAAGQGRITIPTSPISSPKAESGVEMLRRRLTELGLHMPASWGGPGDLNLHFAEGGKVEMKESKLKEIQGAISRLQSKQIAQALEAIRAEKAAMAVPKANGGVVEAPQGGAAENGDPAALYAEYERLLAELENPERDDDDQLLIVERLEQIQDALDALGVETPQPGTG